LPIHIFTIQRESYSTFTSYGNTKMRALKFWHRIFLAGLLKGFLLLDLFWKKLNQKRDRTVSKHLGTCLSLCVSGAAFEVGSLSGGQLWGSAPYRHCSKCWETGSGASAETECLES